ncbi:MaoC family dehydratase [Massilia soli]|uniref:MaoC family dehydratase n=1 Tax=Massilia soli TaxID=2792854 RepID=A0ABS7SQB8_9BURK|nr:MaoC family dehydratase [Massilia soli]MBZ2207510.1 MaoC family dehydratase [Massilia soli]
MLEVTSAGQLRDLVGTEAALSPWMEISQQRINMFADATSDHQWIHVDAERCRRESPFGVPVAHGFLTLSLLPVMFESAVTLRNFRMVLNYGLNKVRFPAPVPVGSRLRARLVLQACDDIEGGTQLVWDVAVEREGEAKPVCVAEFVMRCYL